MQETDSITMQEQPVTMQSAFECVYVRNYLPALAYYHKT